MVSSQLLLGTAVGTLLLLIGAYTLYLWHRLAAVEAREAGRQHQRADGGKEEGEAPTDR